MSENSLNETEILFCSAAALTAVQATSGIGQTKLMKTYNKKEMKDNEATCGKT